MLLKYLTRLAGQSLFDEFLRKNIKWRKVRTLVSRVPGNAWGAKAYGKCRRKYTAWFGLVLKLGKGEKVSVRAHRAGGNISGRVNPTRSKAK